MTRKLITRLGLVAAAGILALTPAISDVLFADALDGGVVTMKAEPGATFSYESELPMPASDAAGAFHDPENCPVVPSCTMVTLEMQPTARTTEVYFVKVVIGWDDTPVAGTAQGNDLDTFMFVERQAVDEETGEPEVNEDGSPNMEFVQIASSASGSEPEQARLLGSGAETFYIVVSNFLGVNTGFTIEGSYGGGEAPDTIFEDLGVSPFSPSQEPSSGPATPSGGIDPGPAPAPGGGVDVPDTSGEVALPAPAPVEPGFANVSPSVALDDLLAASETAGPNSLFTRREVAPPGPVGGLTAFVFMGLVPLALLGAGAAALWKFRPAALSTRPH